MRQEQARIEEAEQKQRDLEVKLAELKAKEEERLAKVKAHEAEMKAEAEARRLVRGRAGGGREYWA